MEQEDNKVDRRNFLSLVTIGIGGLIGLGMGIPAIAYIIGPALKRQQEEWLKLGSTSKVELGVPTLFKKKVVRQSGWAVKENEIVVYILTENGREYSALSNVCTHLGCRVRWIGEEELLVCPCHEAAFEKNGDVSYGPPPAPLDKYEVKVEDDQLFIKTG